MTREVHLPVPSGGRGAGAGRDHDLALEMLADQALLARVRSGDDRAFGELYHRHSDAVRAFAIRSFGSTLDADDITAEAFFRVLQAVRRGTARIDHVRAYLLTVARRVAWEWTARRRDVPVDDVELSWRTGAAGDRSATSAERHLITQAFTSLPERWRKVLWRVEVEGERPAVIAGHFGLSANATAALARRARDGLRAAYLQAHLADSHGPVDCRNVVEKLGAFTAGGVRGAEERRIEAHLRDCASCTALQAELAEVCAGLRVHASVVMGPAIGLGTALAPHFGATSAAYGTGTAWAGKFFGAAGKFASTGGRVKLAVTASAAAAVGVMGVAAGPVFHDQQSSTMGFDGRRGNDVIEVCTTCVPGAHGIPALPSTSAARRSSAGLPGGSFDRRIPAGVALPEHGMNAFDGGGRHSADRRTRDAGLPGSIHNPLPDGVRPQSGRSGTPVSSTVRPSEQHGPEGWPIPQSSRPPATPTSPSTEPTATETSSPQPAPESGTSTSTQRPTQETTPDASTTQRSTGPESPRPLPMHTSAGQ
jgi:RNA polymerase sigma factor (sigma-70 family)